MTKYDNIPKLEPFGRSQLGNKYPSKGNEIALNDLSDQIATILTQTSTDSRKVSEILYLVEESLWLGQIVARAELKGREYGHRVIMSEASVREFKQWLATPNGSFRANERVLFESGGGPLYIETEPYSLKERQGSS